MVKIKEFQTKDVEFDCPICHRHFNIGISAKQIVSGKFTDWAYKENGAIAIVDSMFYNSARWRCCNVIQT